MDVDESKPSFANEIVVRVVLSVVLLGACLGLDLFLHASQIVEAGYSHPHGLGTMRQLLGWVLAWGIGWALMRWFVSFYNRVFGPRDFAHLGRVGIWFGFGFFVLLALPADL